MTTFFYSRHKETGSPASSTGRSSAPHLYHSRAKARQRVGDAYEQVEVVLVEVGAEPTPIERNAFTNTFKEFILAHPGLGEHFTGHAADSLALELAKLAHTLHTSKN